MQVLRDQFLSFNFSGFWPGHIPTEGSSTAFFLKDKVPNIAGVCLAIIFSVNIHLHEDYEYHLPLHSVTHDIQENFQVYIYPTHGTIDKTRPSLTCHCRLEVHNEWFPFKRVVLLTLLAIIVNVRFFNR